MRTIENQITFNKEETKFKECQKQYDSLLKKEKYKENKEKNQSQNMDLQVDDEEKDKNKEKDPKHWKSQKFKALQKVLPYKWVPPLMRKQFLEKLQQRMGRFRISKGQIPEEVQN